MKNCVEIRMFKYVSMIKSLAFCAATFACLSVLFKNSVVIVPEVTEIRVCNIVAVCYGIWFGPAGAWGCALGNLVGDLGGSLTLLSIGGFIANFFSAFLPYKIWEVMGSRYGEHILDRPSMKSTKWVLRYLLAGLASVVSCAIILAITFDLGNSMSALDAFVLVFCNNMAATLVGMILYVIMTRVPTKILPYWREMMRTEPQNISA